MKVINFKSAQCKHCYKCVRKCNVKAISVKNFQAQINEDLCILCGHCLNACPQNAKEFVSDIIKVKRFIANGEKVVLSLAPSYRGIFGHEVSAYLIDALHRLGFDRVGETAVGAVFVTNEYKRLLEEGTMDNIISTCCPSANRLIELYYPSLIPYMAPVVSPMIAHARMLREQLGDKVKIVFAGPCIAKRFEGYEEKHQGLIDAVITFEEIKRWLAKDEITLNDCQIVSPDNDCPEINRLYPISGGVIESIQAITNENDHYQKLQVHGVENCISLCKSLEAGELHHCFIEINACEEACISGPAAGGMDSSVFKRKIDMLKNIKQIAPNREVFNPLSPKSGLKENFTDQSVKLPIPTEDEILEIMAKIGKNHPEDELNCGACGYNTCREKAIAVYQGKAELSMCIPYMEKAGSLANTALTVSPNMTVIVNSDMRILEFSAAAEHHFKISRKEALESTYLFELMDTKDFEWVLEHKQGLHIPRVEFNDYGFIADMRLEYIYKEKAVLCILIDITKEEEQIANEFARNVETVEKAQQVIEKQMTMAHLIAELLGETTAETKVTLTNICQTLLGENEEDKK